MYTCWDCVEVFCHIYLFSCTNTQLRRDIFNLFLKVTLNAATTCLPYFHYRHTWFPCPLFITATLGYLVTLFISHTWLPCPSFHYCYTWLLYHPFHHCHTWLPCPFSSQPYLVTLSPFSSLPYLTALSLFSSLPYLVTLLPHSHSQLPFLWQKDTHKNYLSCQFPRHWCNKMWQRWKNGSSFSQHEVYLKVRALIKKI